MGKDFLTPEERHIRMGRIRSKNTKLELRVRRLIHGMGYRYRLHAADLPGKPDIVFRNRKKVIFVHGCFWHFHEPCQQYRLPTKKLDFWLPKLAGNRQRDDEHMLSLQSLGWEYLIVWECQLKDIPTLTDRIQQFLG